MKQFGLSKNERIKSRKLFQILYENGKTIYSKNGLFKAVFYFMEKQKNSVNVKVAFVVSKKAGNAVWRNRVRRLMREVYRLNKKLLVSIDTGKILLISFSPNKINRKNRPKIKLKDIENEILSLMQKLEEQAKKYSNEKLN